MVVSEKGEARTRVKLNQTTKGLVTWEFTCEGDNEAEVRDRVVRMRAWCEALVKPLIDIDEEM
jgi:hypothetical protein